MIILWVNIQIRSPSSWNSVFGTGRDSNFLADPDFGHGPAIQLGLDLVMSRFKIDVTWNVAICWPMIAAHSPPGKYMPQPAAQHSDSVCRFFVNVIFLGNWVLIWCKETQWISIYRLPTIKSREISNTIHKKHKQYVVFVHLACHLPCYCH